MMWTSFHCASCCCWYYCVKSGPVSANEEEEEDEATVRVFFYFFFLCNARDVTTCQARKNLLQRDLENAAHHVSRTIGFFFFFFYSYEVMVAMMKRYGGVWARRRRRRRSQQRRKCHISVEAPIILLLVASLLPRTTCFTCLFVLDHKQKKK